MIFFDTCTVGRILNRFSSDMYTVDDSLPFILNILLAQFFGLVGKFWIYIKYLDLFILQLYKRVKQTKEMRDKEIVQMHTYAGGTPASIGTIREEPCLT